MLQSVVHVLLDLHPLLRDSARKIDDLAAHSPSPSAGHVDQSGEIVDESHHGSLVLVARCTAMTQVAIATSWWPTLASPKPCLMLGSGERLIIGFILG